MVVVNGRQVVIVRWKERCYAVRNICPHQTIGFVGGRAYDRVTAGAQFGTVELADDDPVLACPRHAFRYRLVNGECLVDQRLRVRTYDVSVRDGRVLVDIARKSVTNDAPAGTRASRVPTQSQGSPERSVWPASPRFT